MLDHLLHEAEQFRYRHGVYPNVVYLNPEHCFILEANHPWLFEGELPLKLGFEIRVLPKSVQPEPTVAFSGDFEDHDQDDEQPWHCELAYRKSA